MTAVRIVIVALLTAVVLLQVPTAGVVAQTGMTTAWFEWGATGFVPGQQFRVSVGNVAARETVQFSVVLLDSQARVLGQSPALPIGPGTFRSVDFSRDALAQAGEPSTARLQVRVCVRIHAATPRDADAMRALTSGLAPSLDLIDTLTGRTVDSGAIGDTRTVISAQASYASANAGLF
jgi:hypothetical protein